MKLKIGIRENIPLVFYHIKTVWCLVPFSINTSCDHVRNEEVLLKSQWADEYPTWNKKQKANWIGHILCRNFLLKQVIEGKIKGEMEVTRTRGRRCKKLLDDLKDRRGYTRLKEEALDRTMWRRLWTCCQTEYWMNDGHQDMAHRSNQHMVTYNRSLRSWCVAQIRMESSLKW